MSQYTEMLLDKIMEHFPGPVRLTEPRGFAITMIVGGIVVMLPCLLLAYPGLGEVVDRFPRKDQVFWGLSGVAIALWPVVGGWLDLRQEHTAVLDTDGFRTASRKGSRWFPWNQVDRFKVVSLGEDGYEVDFVLVHRDGDVEKCRFPSQYGLSTTALTELMTRWRAAALADHRKTKK